MKKIRNSFKSEREIIAKVLKTPEGFFKSIKTAKKANWKKTTQYLVFLTAVRIVIAYLIMLLTSSYNLTLIIETIPQALFSFVVTIVSAFVLSYVTHIYLKTFKAKGTFFNTYELYVYSRTPSILFGWIPFVNVVASIYAIYIMVKATQILHGFSPRKSVLVYVIPIILIIALAVVLVTAYPQAFPAS